MQEKHFPYLGSMPYRQRSQSSNQALAKHHRIGGGDLLIGNSTRTGTKAIALFSLVSRWQGNSNSGTWGIQQQVAKTHPVDSIFALPGCEGRTDVRIEPGNRSSGRGINDNDNYHKFIYNT